uniref:Uncharacterized protein n=2 Tax=Aplanochytrium stocchinoi TaxID=215587 RepID=A0A7S3PE31_9STRA
MLAEVELVGAFSVTIIFWCVLYPGAIIKGIEVKNMTGLISVVVHVFNSVVMLLEFAVNKLDFNLHHLPYILVWPCFFSLYHNILHLVLELAGHDHCPNYPFFAMSKPWSSLYIPALTLGFVLFHLGTYRVFNFLEKVKIEYFVDAKHQSEVIKQIKTD